jgi:hypothetical protein
MKTEDPLRRVKEFYEFRTLTLTKILNFQFFPSLSNLNVALFAMFFI